MVSYSDSSNLFPPYYLLTVISRPNDDDVAMSPLDKCIIYTYYCVLYIIVILMVDEGSVNERIQKQFFIDSRQSIKLLVSRGSSFAHNIYLAQHSSIGRN